MLATHFLLNHFINFTLEGDFVIEVPNLPVFERMSLASKLPSPPTFSGKEDPTEWTSVVERYFAAAEVAQDAQKFILAVALLRSPATRIPDTVNDYAALKAFLVKRYGTTAENAFEQVLQLSQGRNTLEVYIAHFERIAEFANISEQQKVPLFRQGLNDGLKRAVLTAEADNLFDFIAICRRVDKAYQAQRRPQQPQYQPQRQQQRQYPRPQQHHPQQQQKKFNVVNDEINEDKQYSKNQFLFGTLNSLDTTLLLDSGATHCFINVEMAQALNLDLYKPTIGTVLYANGSKGQNYGTVTLELRIGQYVEMLKFQIIDSTYQAVLGLDWFDRLNPRINWPANKFTILHEGKLINLQGFRGQGSSTSIPSIAMVNSVEFTEFYEEGDELFLLNVQALTNDTKEANLPNEIRDFQDVFPEDLPSGLPPHRGDDFQIKLEPGTKPPAKRTYPLTVPQLDELKKQLADYVDKGFIRPSKSPFSAPVLFVKKKDGSSRMCVDYRALNDLTVKDKYPLPRISDLLDRLQGAKIFSKLDLRSGYHQIRINEEDVQKTAFGTRYGQYEFMVLPFGLSNAPSAFMRLMNEVLDPLLDICVIVFIDDILVFSKNRKQHVIDLRRVLELLRKHQLFAKLSKCSFFQSEIEFLGHIISANGIKVDPSKVKAVNDWPAPKTPSELKSFLGLAAFYQKFVRNFSDICIPLTALLKKSVKFIWTDEQQRSFDMLKRALTSAPTLIIPDLNRSFVIHSDASGFAIGAVLQQDHGHGLQPVAFTSRKMKPAEINYPVHEKELLAVIHAVKYWKMYIAGKPVKVFTDHHSLQYFKTQTTFSGRQARWLETILELDVDIVWKKGVDNLVADALSRSPALAATTSQLVIDPEFLTSIKDGYKEDTFFADILDTLKLGSVPPKMKTRVDKFVLKEGLLYFKPGDGDRLCIPSSLKLRTQILHDNHDSMTAGHLGRDRTFEVLSRNYYWPGMYRDVSEYVRTCDSCQKVKTPARQPPGLLNPLEIPNQKWQGVSMDFIVGLPMTDAGFDAIMVVVDRLSKMTHLTPMKTTATAEEVANLFFTNIFRLHGLPVSIVSDRDSKFISDFWQSLFAALDVKLKMSTAFHPQTDGQTERMNQFLEQILRNYVDFAGKNWDKLLTPAEFAINNAHQSSTGFTPFYLNYGFHPQMPVALDKTITVNEETNTFVSRLDGLLKAAKDAISEAQDTQARYANDGRSVSTFKKGDLVLLSSKNLSEAVLNKTHKFSHQFIGPFKVKKPLSLVAYELDLPAALRIHKVFHISRLKEYHDNPPKFDGRISKLPEPELIQGILEYEIDKILETRMFRKKKQYLVQFKGDSHREAEWKYARDLGNAAELIQEFEAGIVPS